MGLLNESESWADNKNQEQRMQLAEMTILRYASGVSEKDRTNNEYIRGNVGLVNIKGSINIGYCGSVA